MSRKYAIIDTANVTDSMAAKTVDGSKAAMRKTVRNTEKSLLRWDGKAPYGTGSLTKYTHDQILSILNDESGDWWVDIQDVIDNPGNYSS